jgi:hypothetical protein
MQHIFTDGSQSLVLSDPRLIEQQSAGQVRQTAGEFDASP